jgi:hypothetical protein
MNSASGSKRTEPDAELRIPKATPRKQPRHGARLRGLVAVRLVARRPGADADRRAANAAARTACGAADDSAAASVEAHLQVRRLRRCARGGLLPRARASPRTRAVEGSRRKAEARIEDVRVGARVSRALLPRRVRTERARDLLVPDAAAPAAASREVDVPRSPTRALRRCLSVVRLADLPNGKGVSPRARCGRFDADDPGLSRGVLLLRGAHATRSASW